jgi:hypothetical protein
MATIQIEISDKVVDATMAAITDHSEMDDEFLGLQILPLIGAAAIGDALREAVIPLMR